MSFSSTMAEDAAQAYHICAQDRPLAALRHLDLARMTTLPGARILLCLGHIHQPGGSARAPVTQSSEAMAAAREAGVLVSFDTNLRPGAWVAPGACAGDDRGGDGH